MRGANRKITICILSLFMVCLIVSTSTTTVTAAPNWGTLKAGDEMQWQSTTWGTIKMKVLNVEGKTITIDFEGRGDKEIHTIDADASIYDFGLRDITPYLFPKSMIDDLRSSTQNYEWQGTTYKAYYKNREWGDGSTSEDWYDFNTGILFEHKFTDATDGTVEVDGILISTNADLAAASGGGCLGTVLIALVSVSAVVSYSVARYRKKETT